MYAIIDHRAPLTVKKNLAKYVNNVFEFSSEGITYNSISGHPDIFMFQDKNNLIIAPNTPKNLINFLNEKSIAFTLGEKPVGINLDNSVLYNCLATDKYFFCKQGKPDSSIQKKHSNKTLINIPQSYARCSMFSVENNIITSDKGIVKTLKKNNITNFYFEPSEIKIKDHKNGFIGGTMGATENTIFFLGNLLKHKDGQALSKFLSINNKEIICLGNDYLYDGGGIFLLNT
ncbi:DUF6873 family GME fold protein [Lutibacter sp.]|uniref:DUF6873 family GME fold protein n=1 Tax=Lutibacter sp. TaxID=1925666 RepID=UPI003563CC1E